MTRLEPTALTLFGSRLKFSASSTFALGRFSASASSVAVFPSLLVPDLVMQVLVLESMASESVVALVLKSTLVLLLMLVALSVCRVRGRCLSLSVV